jgi:hypothetical protein
LAAVMVISGSIAIAFNIHMTLENQGPPVWRTGGLAILQRCCCSCCSTALGSGIARGLKFTSDSC